MCCVCIAYKRYNKMYKQCVIMCVCLRAIICHSIKIQTHLSNLSLFSGYYIKNLKCSQTSLVIEYCNIFRLKMCEMFKKNNDQFLNQKQNNWMILFIIGNDTRQKSQVRVSERPKSILLIRSFVHSFDRLIDRSVWNFKMFWIELVCFLFATQWIKSHVKSTPTLFIKFN